MIPTQGVGARGVRVPSLLSIRSGALADLPGDLVAVFDPSGVVIVSGPQTSHTIATALAQSLMDIPVTLVSTREGTVAEATRVAALVGESRASLVVAVGGGKTIDVAKLAAHHCDVHFVSVPTILSHDGMASPVSSLDGGDGTRSSIGAGMPAGVVIDLDVVAGAPERFMRAGVGDLLSNLTAVADWRASHARTGEPFDEFAASIAQLSAKASLDVSAPFASDDVEVVARGLVMSGLAMEMAGSSRPCSGTEHLISHALDRIRGKDADLHGEQVAIGVLLTSYLQKSPFRGPICDLYDRIGLPRSLEGWGLDIETMVAAVRLAPATRPGRWTSLTEMDLSAPVLEPIVRAAFSTDE